MHQLRNMLCRLRYRALEPRLSRASGAQPRVDARQRRPRRRQRGAPRGRRRRRGLLRLPLAPVLPGVLPAGAQPDCVHCRPQAPHGGRLSQGREQGMNVRLYVWQRATAALMLPLVLLHVAVIFYATRRGMTAADILARTHGSIVWAALYGTFVVAAAIHAAIGVRNVLIEWSPRSERTNSLCTLAVADALVLLDLLAIAAVVLGWPPDTWRSARACCG